MAALVVIKLGTQVVVDGDCLALERLVGIVRDCVALQRAGNRVIVVTSGAVGLGRYRLGLSGTLTLAQKQACAAVGQSLLMAEYQHLFGHYGIHVAQVLLTAQDFTHRRHYLNLQAAVTQLLDLGVVPIVNENDTVSTAELDGVSGSPFGDNDRLSALVAGKLGAQSLLLLSNVDGVYTANPALDPTAERLPVIDDWRILTKLSVEGASEGGRGGMATKLAAAKIAALSGIETYVASGFEPHIIKRLLLDGETATGTRIAPVQGGTRPSARRQWIAHASGYAGDITINPCAVAALIERGASLLPVGIVGVSGQFQPGDVVRIIDEAGDELGRGVSGYPSEVLSTIAGQATPAIQEKLGTQWPEEAIHRDNLALYAPELPH